MDALERWQFSCVEVLLALVVIGICLEHPEGLLSLFLDVAVVEVNSGADGASTMT